MALLGEGYNLSSTGNDDYSDVISANNQAYAQQRESLGAIASGINDYVKQQREIQKNKNEAATLIDSAAKLGLDVNGNLASLKQKMNDPSLSSTQQADLAGQIKDLINMNVQVYQNNQKQSNFGKEFALKSQEAANLDKYHMASLDTKEDVAGMRGTGKIQYQSVLGKDGLYYKIPINNPNSQPADNGNVGPPQSSNTSDNIGVSIDGSPGVLPTLDSGINGNAGVARGVGNLAAPDHLGPPPADDVSLISSAASMPNYQSKIDPRLIADAGITTPTSSVSTDPTPNNSLRSAMSLSNEPVGSTAVDLDAIRSAGGVPDVASNEKIVATRKTLAEAQKIERENALESDPTYAANKKSINQSEADLKKAQVNQINLNVENLSEAAKLKMVNEAANGLYQNLVALKQGNGYDEIWNKNVIDTEAAKKEDSLMFATGLNRLFSGDVNRSANFVNAQTLLKQVTGSETREALTLAQHAAKGTRLASNILGSLAGSVGNFRLGMGKENADKRIQDTVVKLRESTNPGYVNSIREINGLKPDPDYAASSQFGGTKDSLLGMQEKDTRIFGTAKILGGDVSKPIKPSIPANIQAIMDQYNK